VSGEVLDVDADQTENIHQLVFLTRLGRYLRGKGHPDHPNLGTDWVDVDERNRVAQDSTFRSIRFLKAISGTEILPDDGRKLTVRLGYCNLSQ
jgi:hypothetical protein